MLLCLANNLANKMETDLMDLQPNCYYDHYLQCHYMGGPDYNSNDLYLALFVTSFFIRYSSPFLHWSHTPKGRISWTLFFYLWQWQAPQVNKSFFSSFSFSMSNCQNLARAIKMIYLQGHTRDDSLRQFVRHSHCQSNSFGSTCLLCHTRHMVLPSGHKKSSSSSLCSSRRLK